MAEYIDREVFKKSVEEYYCKPCKADGKDHNGCWCRACLVDDMLDEIDCFQQAADVAPVVHAHWKPYEDTVQCSACGFGTFMDGYFLSMESVPTPTTAASDLVFAPTTERGWHKIESFVI